MDTVSDQKIARLVATQGRTRVYELEDGDWLTAHDGTVAWRNNNPGNLKFEFKGSADATVHAVRTKEKALKDAQERYIGIVDLDQWGNAIFESYEAGRDAHEQLLTSDSMLDKTVDELVKSYSTADYSGETHYAHQTSIIYATAKAEGFDLHGKKIRDMTTSERDALADGVAKAESWKAGVIEVTSPLNEAELKDALKPHAPEPPFHIYREGDHGEAVGRFQQELADLGFTSKGGAPIEPDHIFGGRTKEAVKAFQKSQGLLVDGTVGKNTARALEHAALQSSALQAIAMDNPQHPGYPLFQQSLACVGKLDESQGRATNFQSYNLSGVLALAAKREGLERIDHVVLSDDTTRAIAVQGDLHSPLRRLADVDILSGINTPLAQSSTDWTQFQPPVGAIQAPSSLIQTADVQVTPPAMQR